MKDPDKKFPNALGYIPYFMIGFIFITLPIIVLNMAAQKAGVQMNYEFGNCLYGFGGLIIWAATIRLANIAHSYIWHYKALVAYLNKRGLNSFVQEAKKITDLKKV